MQFLSCNRLLNVLYITLSWDPVSVRSYYQKQKARFITTNVIKGRPSLLTLVPGAILSRTGKQKNKITPNTSIVEKNIIYNDLLR